MYHNINLAYGTRFDIFCGGLSHMDLRRECPAVKIIAVSGGGRTGNLSLLDIAQRLGAQRTLQKPFGLRDMLATVHELLQEQSNGIPS